MLTCLCKGENTVHKQTACIPFAGGDTNRETHQFLLMHLPPESRPMTRVLCGMLCLLLASSVQAEEKISFRKQVAPILVKHCQGCHGPKDFKGGYQLHTYETLLKPGETGFDAVVPGKPEDSYLYELLVNEDDPEGRMPKDSDPLPKQQIALIKRWIASGAKFDGNSKQQPLSELMPQAKHPEPPSVYRAALPITAVAFHPSGNEVAVSGYHEVTVWNPEDGKLLRRIPNLPERTYGLAYHQDGQRLAVASGTPGQLGEIKLFNAETGETIHNLASMSDVATDVAFSPDGNRLAACGADGSIRIFEVASGEEVVRVVEAHADWVMSVTFSPDGKWLASSSRDKSAKVFDAQSGESRVGYSEHRDTVHDVAWADDGKTLFSAGANREIHQWQLEDAKQLNRIRGFGGDVFQITIHDGQLFSCCADRRLRQHEVSNQKLKQTFTGHNEWVYKFALHPTSGRMISGGFDGEVIVWDTEQAAVLTKFLAAPGLQAK